MENVFFQDPWWLILIKVVALFVILLLWTIFNVWYERRLVGKMQHRLGPIMNGPFGLGQALADGAKLIAKEDFRPKNADKWIFNLAPILTGVAAFTCWTVIPFGGEVTMFGVETRLQVTDLPVATIFILAVASIGIYGIVLAGWAGNSTYSFLGSIRSTAQMISYEISMGLSYVAVFLYAGSMSTGQIVEAQGLPLFGSNPLGLQRWYWLLLLPSFVIYVISMLGESNRVPFDLPECESELVSGHITEYTGFRYAIFYLTEYINMTTLSAIMVTLFMGGYKAIWPLGFLIPDTGWWGLLWFVIKVQLGIFFFVWVRASLPRFRYDQFMGLGWKWLIPISLGWVMVIALLRALTNHGLLQGPLLWILIGVVVLGLLAVIFLGGGEPKDLGMADRDEDVFDAFAGGYPVPPLPGQTLPELADVVAGSSTDSDVTAAAASDDDRKDA